MKTLVSSTFLALAASACASAPKAEIVRVPVPYSGAGAAPMAIQDTGRPSSETASLWDTSAESLLSMRRAKNVGDLLTVVVEMNDQASLQNSLSRSRNSNENANVNALLGLPQWANGVLPGGASVSPAVDMNRTSNVNGSGAVNRAEKITFTLASRVVGVEPNGNLIIEGFQQTQVSNEVRYLSVSGVIRAQDITRENTVTYDKIADAQLSYLSDGEATGAINRGIVPKVVDKVLPF